MLSHLPVNFRSPLNKLLLALGVLALVSAQLFGVGRGFLCDCSGGPVFTASDHCHGPHGTHCLDNEEPPHSGDSHPDDGDALPHSPIVQDFQSASTSTAEWVLAQPVLHVVLTLDDSHRAKTEPVFALENAAELRGSPPCGVAVARTIVLLI